MDTQPPSGRVMAVCLRPTSGIPKFPQPAITLTNQGVEGDWHAGPVNKHKKRGDPEPNWRQVSVVAQEVYTDLEEALGIRLQAGAFGENILVEGLGDLSGLKPGDRLHLGAEAVIEVTQQNRPCATLQVHHPDIVGMVVGRRGVVGVVLRPGVVRPGDRVWVERPTA
ncbi:MAG: MOSC domain-containing protein [Dehalococcoidia bacterium]|nr:MOSC domain-containing protein [Dehalococcoidia bacterium]MDW8119335.1 MOSC domain-containing protein [Chloroflexota bacterium]